MKNLISFVVFFILFIKISFSQESIKNHSFDIALGVGSAYGGTYGAKISVFPIQAFSIFFAANPRFECFNFGGQAQIVPHNSDNAFRINTKLMYGTNNIYYPFKPGTTIGIGLEFRFGRSKYHGLDLDISIPSSKHFKNVNVRVIHLISIGYHFEI
ncbi:MAG: hypothetical protein A2033_14955 [Bacteroidetes bacterium GWA2_31_9]|nr:MAG: hypothetical protein A2033_14955 [Bacteroidetes bacterium GWA2_31_9]